MQPRGMWKQARNVVPLVAEMTARRECRTNKWLGISLGPAWFPNLAHDFGNPTGHLRVSRDKSRYRRCEFHKRLEHRPPRHTKLRRSSISPQRGPGNGRSQIYETSTVGWPALHD